MLTNRPSGSPKNDEVVDSGTSIGRNADAFAVNWRPAYMPTQNVETLFERAKNSALVMHPEDARAFIGFRIQALSKPECTAILAQSFDDLTIQLKMRSLYGASMQEVMESETFCSFIRKDHPNIWVCDKYSDFEGTLFEVAKNACEKIEKGNKKR